MHLSPLTRHRHNPTEALFRYNQWVQRRLLLFRLTRLFASKILRSQQRGPPDPVPNSSKPE